MDEARRRRIEDEADAALNLSRVLRAQLRGAQPTPEDPAPVGSIETKRRVHTWLDRIQDLTPEFLRAAVRPLYLNLFYRRVFPEYAQSSPPQRVPLDSGLAAWSGFAPFLEYKQRVCRTLNMDFRGFRRDCRARMVSVVLPVFNGAKYVADAIDTVLAQTYSNLELIVVDDGSTDQTPQILTRYARDPRVRIIAQPNRKLPAALNAGFREASGEFFTWLSDDNLMRPDMLSTLVDFLDANLDAEMVYVDEELIDESGRPALNSDFCREYQTPPGSNVLLRPRDPGPLSFVQNNYIGGCFLYRSWAARATGDYCETCFGFEDYEYWLRMNALFRIAHLGRRTILYSYRLHPGSLTAREKELQIAARARYFLPVDEERRRFFASSFDITLVGRHPWFRPLARAYRQAGHNVFELDEITTEALYRHRATRAFPKPLVVSTAPTEFGDFAILRDNRITIEGRDWFADSASDLEYPLLAIANSALWRQ